MIFQKTYLFYPYLIFPHNLNLHHSLGRGEKAVLAFDFLIDSLVESALRKASSYPLRDKGALLISWPS